MDRHAPPHEHDLREVFNALRWLVRAGAPWRLPNDLPPWEAVYQQSWRWLDAGCFEAMASDLRSIIRVAQGCQGQPSAMVMDGRTLQSSCESGQHAGYDGYKRKRGSKVHIAVDTLDHLLAMHITPADEQQRTQVHTLCEQVQQATGHTVELAWADQAIARQAAQDNGINLQIVKLERFRAAVQALRRGAQLRVADEVSPSIAGL